MQVEAEHLGKYVSRCGSTFIGETTGYYDIVRATTGVNPVTGEELTAAERTKHAGLAAAGKAEYGLYGLTTANGLGEYVTGRDMFGNELSEEQRERSLNEAFALLVGNAVGVGLRKASLYLNVRNEKGIPKSEYKNL